MSIPDRCRFLTLLFALAPLTVSVAGTLDGIDPTPGTTSENLPRALVIGDSISMGYRKPLKALLEGKIDVERVPGNAGHTGMGLERLEEWLAPERGQWDVIHFNFGLWDLCYRHSESKVQGRRDKLRGELPHTIEQYAKNLEQIVRRFEDTRAELVWGTTTPVPEGEAGRKLGDDLRYNEVAARVMKRHGVRVNDLHALARGRMKELARGPGDVHFTEEGSALLAAQVAKALIAAAARQAKRRTSPWQPARLLTYKEVGEVRLRLHVFEPQGHAPAKRAPAIVFFFGGGWVGGSPSQFYPHCAHLAERGVVAMSAEYRVKSRHDATPFDCVEDGKSAIRWIRRKAQKLGIDPQRIAAGGGSAGGHVAAATATLPGLDRASEDLAVSSKPAALVLFNPVYDNGPGGWGHARVKERYREISPAHNIRRGIAPAIVFLGTADPLVPVATAKSFQSAMRAVGSRSELVLYEDRQHGFFNQGRAGNVDYLHSIERMDAFLEELGFLKAAKAPAAP